MITYHRPHSLNITAYCIKNDQLLLSFRLSLVQRNYIKQKKIFLALLEENTLKIILNEIPLNVIIWNDL